LLKIYTFKKARFELELYKWLACNLATSLNDPYRVVLSAEEVKHYFGTFTPQEAIGRTVIYRNSLQTYVFPASVCQFSPLKRLNAYSMKNL